MNHPRKRQLRYTGPWGYYYMPYAVELTVNGHYVVMSRGYKPVGTGCGSWSSAEIPPVSIQIPDLERAAASCFHDPERLPVMGHFISGREDFHREYFKRLDVFGSLKYIDAEGREGLIRETFYPRQIRYTNDDKSYVVNAKGALLGVDPTWSSGGCGQLAFAPKTHMLYLYILNEKWLDIGPHHMSAIQRVLKRPIRVEPLETSRRWDAEKRAVISSFGSAA